MVGAIMWHRHLADDVNIGHKGGRCSHGLLYHTVDELGREHREGDWCGEYAILGLQLSSGDLLIHSDDPEGPQELNLRSALSHGRGGGWSANSQAAATG